MDVNTETVQIKPELDFKFETEVERDKIHHIDYKRLDYAVKKEKNSYDFTEIPFEHIKIESIQDEMCDNIEKYEYTDANQHTDRLHIKEEDTTKEETSCANLQSETTTELHDGETNEIASHNDMKHQDKLWTQHLVYSEADKQSFSCYTCEYMTDKKIDLITHMKEHEAVKNKAPRVSHLNQSNQNSCTECNKVYKQKAGLHNHILRNHPNLIPSISSKIHKCSECPYQTTNKRNLHKHVLMHKDGLAKLYPCVHCGTVFKSKIALDDHIVKKHPNYISSTTNKIHECTKCPYKTVLSIAFAAHMLEHPDEEPVGYSVFTCIHCNKRCRSKLMLSEHIIEKHPDFISSVTNKIHECTKCEFKTTFKGGLARHMLKHSEIRPDFKVSICVYCRAMFRNNLARDDHIIKKHPEYINSVTSKTHNCSHCPFKTTVKKSFDVHMLKHSEVESGFKFLKCTDCNLQFKDKRYLDNHIFKNHPELMASVTDKLIECPKCTYKAILKWVMSKHISIKHPEIAPSPS